MNDSAGLRVQAWLEKALEENAGGRHLFETLEGYLKALLPHKDRRVHLRYLELAVSWLEAFAGQQVTRTQLLDWRLQVGRAFEANGQPATAARIFKHTITMAARWKLPRKRAESLRRLGNLHARQNRWQAAHRVLSESLELCQKHNDRTGLSNALNGLGILHFEQGDFEQSLSYWQQALELAEAVDDVILIASIYNNLGAWANVQGQWERALANYNESLPRFESAGDVVGMAEAYHNMGMTYADNQKWMDAGVCYEKSHQFALEANDLLLQATVKLNRVELYLAIGDFSLAEALCRQSLKGFERAGDSLGKADALKLLGCINTARRRWKRAEAHFKESIALARRFKSPLGEAEARFELGVMNKNRGRIKASKAELTKALRLFEKLNAQADIAKTESLLKDL